MFKNFNVTSRLSDHRIEVNVQWHWDINADTNVPPFCKVFCCTIPENLLLKNSVFSRSEILDWVNRERLDISSESSRVANIEAYYSNPNNRDHCVFHIYQFINGGEIHSTQQLIFGHEDLNKIFILCAYGERSFETRTFAVRTEVPAPNLIKPSFIDKLKGNKNNRLVFENSAGRRRVIVTKDDAGAPLYSIIPEGDEFYVDNDFELSSIDEIIYLSALIGN